MEIVAYIALGATAVLVVIGSVSMAVLAVLSLVEFLEEYSERRRVRAKRR